MKIEQFGWKLEIKKDIKDIEKIFALLKVKDMIY